MTEPPSSAEVELDEPIESLSPDESQLFKSLIQVGRLTQTLDVYGHEILISTLTVGEDIQVGLLLKPYIDTHSFQRAYRALIASAAVRTIDGEELISRLSSSDPSVTVAEKFQKIKLYFPIVIDKIYDGLTELENRVTPLLSRLGKPSV